MPVSATAVACRPPAPTPARSRPPASPGIHDRSHRLASEMGRETRWCRGGLRQQNDQEDTRQPRWTSHLKDEGVALALTITSSPNPRKARGNSATVLSLLYFVSCLTCNRRLDRPMQCTGWSLQCSATQRTAASSFCSRDLSVLCREVRAAVYSRIWQRLSWRRRPRRRKRGRTW